jgi:glycosyltransferase involved in cell wall biosynthesis
MKVCFVHYDATSDVSGVSSWLQRLMPLLQKSGIEVKAHLMGYGGKPGVNCAFLRECGVPVRLIPFQFHVPYAVRSLLHLLEEDQPDIYVPGGIIPAYYAAGYARRAGVATVGVLHNDDPVYWGIIEEFITGASDFAVSAIVPVSRFLESQVSSMAAVRGITVRRIAYGVPIPAKTAELSNSVFRLVYIGRLVEEQKRISDVTAALCAVAEKIPNVEAWILGEGPARDSVEDIIREKAMGSRVRLLERVGIAQIYEALAQCHGLVLLSDYEGLPISVLESMAVGVVPICLDIRSGIREVVDHGVNGLVVKDRTSDFFNTVKDLRDNPAKWRQLSLAARHTVEQRHSIEGCARLWVDLLEDLDRRRSERAVFRAPRMVRLPPPNPKFGVFGLRLPWKERLEEYVRATPPMYRMAKATMTIGRKVKGEVERWI